MTQQRTWLSSEVIVCVELGIKVIFAYEYAILYINAVFETRVILLIKTGP